MSPKTRRRWGTMLMATILATVATLSARAWDDNHRLKGFQICEDLNDDGSKDQFSPSDCLEGHGCVICEYSGQGELQGEGGEGPGQYVPGMPFGCGGARLIGTCLPNGTNGNRCDISQYTVDGVCTGAIMLYGDQSE